MEAKRLRDSQESAKKDHFLRMILESANKCKDNRSHFERDKELLARRQCLFEKGLALRKQKEEDELRQCTFKPICSSNRQGSTEPIAVGMRTPSPEKSHSSSVVTLRILQKELDATSSTETIQWYRPTIPSIGSGHHFFHAMNC
jgi:hypothetical protein